MQKFLEKNFSVVGINKYGGGGGDYLTCYNFQKQSAFGEPKTTFFLGITEKQQITFIAPFRSVVVSAVLLYK
jgi:hypothetical protein